MALSLEPNNVTASELYESIKEVIQMEEDVSSLERQVASSSSSSVGEPAAAAAAAISARERIQTRVSRKFRNSIVEEEVWEEMIQGEEEDHSGSSQGMQEKPSLQHSRHPEETRIFRSAKQGQDGHEKKHGKEIQGKGAIQLEKGKHTTTAQHQATSSAERRKKHFEVGSHSRQEKHANASVSLLEKYERYTPEKHIAIKTSNYGREKHPKPYASSRENSREVDARETAKKKFKFVHGDDIRIVLVPESCRLLQVMDIARYKYDPHLKSFLLKFMDKEGDLVTITSTEDLRWVEDLYPQVPVRLHIKEVSPEGEITRDLVMPTSSSFAEREQNNASHYYSSARATDDDYYGCGGSSRKEDEQQRNHPCADDDWMVQFARLFKNHAGFDYDACVDLRDLGIRLYYEAMEDTITSEEAQEMFQAAEAKFQEMAALALFNWGNAHMSRARKRLVLSEDTSRESVLAQVRSAYEWACAEYARAGRKFEGSVDVKPDFYEGLIALGQQQFEQARLSWRYADTCGVDMGTEVLELFNHAEDNMEKGMEMWEGMEYLRVKGLSKSRKGKVVAVDKLGLSEQGKDLSPDEAFEQASNMRSQLNISWGAILYERSVVEFKLGLSSWGESLQEAIEKFKTGGASVADISVMVKNHCVNGNNQEGLSFNIDEIVQAWNEMYDAKKLKNGSSSFRLEPIFRRRPSKLHNILEHMHCS